VIATIAIPEDGPLFAGHFPGHPILPGIAELTLVARALASEAPFPDVSAIPFARFRGLVRPADALEIAASPRGEGRFRFEVRRQGELVANGAMTFGVPRPDSRERAAVVPVAAHDVPPFRELIPHRPPMLFVERFIGESDDGATCLGRVPHDCALVETGLVPTFVALEAAAQTAAAWEALRRSRVKGVTEARTGLLVSLRDVVLHRRTIDAGADLIASIRLAAMAPPLATYDVEVSVEGGPALAGTIGTYLSD
jgi:predicted hotdog family 3-hydroxylacyl-ACP dehydratase